jgi:hypothetical protein
MDNQHESPQGDKATGAKHRRTGRMWLWFMAGYLVVFVAMALFVNVYAMTLSSRVVMRCPLWQFYILEFRRAMGPSANVLGPASGSASAAIETALQHVLISVAGGLVFLGIRWGVPRIRR